MDYRRVIAPVAMGVLLVLLYGPSNHTLFLGIAVPVLFNILASGLWIIPIVFLIVLLSRGLMLVLLLLMVLLVFFLEELFIEKSYPLKTIVRYNDFYVLLGCIGVSFTVFLYVLMVVNAFVYTSTGLMAVVAQMYSTREGITVVYLVVLLLASGLLEKIVTPWRKSFPREGFVSKLARRIAIYSSDPGLVFSRSMFLLMLVITVYLGSSCLPALALAYIIYKVFPYKKYAGALAVTVFILYLIVTGLYTELYGINEWLETIVKNIDESIKYSSG
ncbi:hypothetical protein J4526_03690 [Desulfurococcaceae archaeon MEX13E-LK6-19]|nr:hypothetical protein J4526_03690 [Desulfurococcaceae archaeon MEX13E-LK6-19]